MGAAQDSEYAPTIIYIIDITRAVQGLSQPPAICNWPAKPALVNLAVPSSLELEAKCVIHLAASLLIWRTPAISVAYCLAQKFSTICNTCGS